MLSINTNLSSLITQRSMKTATNLLNQAVERMSTGYKVNHAKDNAAAYSIITNMDTKIGAYQVAEDNCAMGLDMLTTATESLDLIYDKLTRLRDLAEQASNGTYGAQSLKAINSEANALVDEINRIYSTAEYNGNKLFEGGYIEPTTFKTAIVKRDTNSMTKLASVDPDVDLADDTYSISTPEELKKLADMTNAGLVSAGDEFVLAKDIDLSIYSSGDGWVPIGINQSNAFKGVFDGNGYEVSNLTINNTLYGAQGLFGNSYGTISNLGVIDSRIVAHDKMVGGIVGSAHGVILNCYFEGDLEGSIVGGIVGGQGGSPLQITNCYAKGNYYSTGITSGILGARFTQGRTIIASCDTYANIKGDNMLAGLTHGVASGSAVNGDIQILDCSVQSYSEDLYYVIGAELGNHTISGFSFNEKYLNNNCAVTKSNTDLLNYTPLYFSNNVKDLQVGISGNEYSIISVDIGFALQKLRNLRNIGLVSDDYISEIDGIFSILSAKQTELGAVQNRLESALEEISTQYENLVSSRSTLRDADIAEVSSQYIQQQILQQASATLMATANQAPSIALQLI